MPEFTVRYWFGDDVGGTPSAAAYVSEGVSAPTLDDAERLARERMQQPFFGMESDGHGRVIVNRDRVRFCSVLPAATPEESNALAQAIAAAHNAERDVYAARAADAARDVDLARERF